jgi:hypothetical protein
MKVIGTDNFCRDEVDEFLVADGLTEEEADNMVIELNSKEGKYRPTYYRAVEDAYKLYIWEP